MAARSDPLDDILAALPVLAVAAIGLLLLDRAQRGVQLLPDIRLGGTIQFPSIQFPSLGPQVPQGPIPSQYVSNVTYEGPRFVRPGSLFQARIRYLYSGPAQDVRIRIYLVGRDGQVVSGAEARGNVGPSPNNVAPADLVAGSVPGSYTIRVIFETASGTQLADVMLTDAVIVHPLVFIQ